jgi:(2Fe-2S) ferredoxin
MAYYTHHLFFCTNQRQSGKRCCAQGEAEALRQYAKKKLKQLGLHGPSQARANACGCLDRCDEGPVLVIYPEGTWYSYKTYTDIDEIIEKHVIGGQKVTRLLISASPFSESKE